MWSPPVVATQSGRRNEAGARLLRAPPQLPFLPIEVAQLARHHAVQTFHEQQLLIARHGARLVVATLKMNEFVHLEETKSAIFKVKRHRQQVHRQR